jgi:hypothetical protein
LEHNLLFRRISKHLKEQNWFAVAIDFFIVVIGVYIGLQVQEWSVNKDKQKREIIYLSRLHTEVLQTLDLREYIAALRFRIGGSLDDVYTKLTYMGEQKSLTKNECSAIASAHIMSDITADLPTLTELLSAGQLDTISSIEVRTNLIKLIQTRNRGGDALVSITKNSTISPMYQLYPELIKLRGYDILPLSSDGIFNPECDSKQMRNNQAFKNDLIDMRTRYSGYVGIIGTETESLMRLHLILDKELGITHEEQ